jgi:hypothetical protein
MMERAFGVETWLAGHYPVSIAVEKEVVKLVNYVPDTLPLLSPSKVSVVIAHRNNGAVLGTVSEIRTWLMDAPQKANKGLV